jgi:hypothetical protein
VDLLVTSVEPRSAKPEIRSVGAGREAEQVGVEGQRRPDVIDIDGHVVHSLWSHEPSVASAVTLRSITQLGA